MLPVVSFCEREWDITFFFLIYYWLWKYYSRRIPIGSFFLFFYSIKRKEKEFPFFSFSLSLSSNYEMIRDLIHWKKIRLSIWSRSSVSFFHFSSFSSHIKISNQKTSLKSKKNISSHTPASTIKWLAILSSTNHWWQQTRKKRSRGKSFTKW